MAKLLNLSNAEAPVLSSHQAAVHSKWAVALESCFSASTLTVIPDPVGYWTPSPWNWDAQADVLSSFSEEIGHRKKGKSKAKG
jgi:hypothetical protein